MLEKYQCISTLHVPKVTFLVLMVFKYQYLSSINNFEVSVLFKQKPFFSIKSINTLQVSSVPIHFKHQKYQYFTRIKNTFQVPKVQDFRYNFHELEIFASWSIFCNCLPSCMSSFFVDGIMTLGIFEDVCVLIGVVSTVCTVSLGLCIFEAAHSDGDDSVLVGLVTNICTVSVGLSIFDAVPPDIVGEVGGGGSRFHPAVFSFSSSSRMYAS